MKKGYRRLVIIGLCVAIFLAACDFSIFLSPCQVQAAKKDELKQQNEEDEGKLEDLDDQVNELEGEQESIDTEIQILSNQIAEIMASISLLEEEIEAKKVQIEQAKIDLEEAQKVERQQYEAMKVRVKAVYESGETSFLDILSVHLPCRICSIRRTTWRRCTSMTKGCLPIIKLPDKM